MDYYIRKQIENLNNSIRTFNTGIKIALIQNDGIADHKEAKAIKQLEKISNRYLEEVERILQKL